MDNRSNNLWKFGTGLLIGGAVGFYLNSEKGKRLRREVSTTVKNQADQASERLNQWAEDAKSYYESVASSAKDQISKMGEGADSMVKDVKTSLLKGAERAKAKLDAASNHIEEQLENHNAK